MRPPRQEGVTEALIEFHKKSPESRGDFFFFFFNLPQLAVCSSSGPTPLFQHIPFLGSVYTGKGLPGRLTSPPSTNRAEPRCGAGRAKSAPVFSGCCFSQLVRPPIGLSAGCQLRAAHPPPVVPQLAWPPSDSFRAVDSPALNEGKGRGSVLEMGLLGRRASALPYEKASPGSPWGADR